MLKLGTILGKNVKTRHPDKIGIRRESLSFGRTEKESYLIASDSKANE
jgi:hypothetical protein